MICCKAVWRSAGLRWMAWGVWWGCLAGEAGWANEVPPGSGWDVETVLVLASEDGQSRLEDEQIQGMRETLPPNVELRIDYLDAKRMSMRRHYAERYETVFHGKYRVRKPAVVVALNDEAVRVLGHYRDTIFNGLPRVVCGSQRDQASQFLSDSNGWTGVFSQPDLSATIELALALHPGVRRVHVLTSSTVPGRLVRDRLRRERAAGRYSAELVIPAATERIWGKNTARDYVRSVAPEDLVFLADYQPDSWGSDYFSHRMFKGLIDESRCPVYTTQKDVIGYGAVGGHVVDGRQMGRKVGELVGRVLSGEPAKRIRLVRVEGVWQFDHIQLRRWGIPERRLPEGSRIVNRPYGEWRRHWKVYLAVVGLVLLEGSIIIQLIVSRQRRIRSMRALEASELRYRNLFEISRNLFLVLGPDGKIRHANPSACRYLRYPLEDLCGRPVGEVVAEEDREAFLGRLGRVLAGEEMLWGVSLRVRDGTPMEVEAFLHPCQYGGQPAAICTAHPLSEQIKLQRIAQEISEREREALGCDIHDGLGPYGTALQLTLHGLKEQAKQGRLVDAARLETLEAITGRLVREIRSLARTLVPLSMVDRTLEQAVAEMVDFARRIFGMDCALTYGLDERRIEVETAPQIYWIIQEQLRNAHRHAGARSARIELGMGADGRGYLAVTTDGEPYEVPTGRRTGLGLSIMEYRARLIGGALAIGVEDAGQTRLTCIFPLRPAPTGKPAGAPSAGNA